MPNSIVQQRLSRKTRKNKILKIKKLDNMSHLSPGLYESERTAASAIGHS